MKFIIKQLVLYTLSISIVLYSYAQHKGNNFELTNKSDRPICFSLSDPAKVFKVLSSNNKTHTASFITVPAAYQRAPERYTQDLHDFFNDYKNKLITLAPNQSLGTFVDITKPVQLIIGRNKNATDLNATQLDELALYGLAPHKALFLKINKYYTLVPQKGTRKLTMQGIQRFSRSGALLYHNIIPAEIQLIHEITTSEPLR